jgi:hypothetical protein
MRARLHEGSTACRSAARPHLIRTLEGSVSLRIQHAPGVSGLSIPRSGSRITRDASRLVPGSVLSQLDLRPHPPHRSPWLAGGFVFSPPNGLERDQPGHAKPCGLAARIISFEDALIVPFCHRGNGGDGCHVRSSAQVLSQPELPAIAPVSMIERWGFWRVAERISSLTFPVPSFQQSNAPQ